MTLPIIDQNKNWFIHLRRYEEVFPPFSLTLPTTTKRWFSLLLIVLYPFLLVPFYYWSLESQVMNYSLCNNFFFLSLYYTNFFTFFFTKIKLVYKQKINFLSFCFNIRSFSFTSDQRYLGDQSYVATKICMTYRHWWYSCWLLPSWTRNARLCWHKPSLNPHLTQFFKMLSLWRYLAPIIRVVVD